MSKYSYEIEEHPAELGGGWRLRLLKDGQEVDVRIFLPTYYGNFTDDETAFQFAQSDARAEGKAWVESRQPAC